MNPENSQQSLAEKIKAAQEKSVLGVVERADVKREEKQEIKAKNKEEREKRAAEMKENIKGLFTKTGEAVKKFRKWDRQNMLGFAGTIGASKEIAGIVGQAALDKGKEVGTAAVQGAEKVARAGGKLAVETGKTIFFYGVEVPVGVAIGVGLLVAEGTQNFVTEKWEQAQELGRKTAEKATDLQERAGNKINSWVEAGRSFRDSVVDGVKSAGEDIRDRYDNTKAELKSAFIGSVEFVIEEGTKMKHQVEDGLTKIDMGVEAVRRDIHGGVAELLGKGALGLSEAANFVFEKSSENRQKATEIAVSRNKMADALHSKN